MKLALNLKIKEQEDTIGYQHNCMHTCTRANCVCTGILANVKFAEYNTRTWVHYAVPHAAAA